jgi:hypothetical protein
MWWQARGEVLTGCATRALAGDRLAIRLQCRKTWRGGGNSRTGRTGPRRWRRAWSMREPVRASFRFDVPANLLASGAGEQN